MSHDVPGISESLDQHFRCYGAPSNLLSSGICLHIQTVTANAVNTTKQLWLCELRRRTPPIKPSASIDHQQTPISIFQNVRRMKFATGRTQKFVLSEFIGGTTRSCLESHNLATVEKRYKQVIAPALIKHPTAIPCHSRYSDMSKPMRWFQKRPTHFEFIEHAFTMGIRTTVQPVHQAINSGTRIKNIDGSQHIPVVGEINFHGIIHPATTMNPLVRTIWKAGK